MNKKHVEYYIIKILTEELVSNSNGPFYTIDMHNEAKNKTLYVIESGIDCKLDESIISDPNHFLKRYYIVKNNWLEPAPQHLIVAARLRGEI